MNYFIHDENYEGLIKIPQDAFASLAVQLNVTMVRSPWTVDYFTSDDLGNGHFLVLSKR